VAGASRPRFGSVQIRDRGHLPHWEKEGAAYFITFRLADSLPKSVFDRIESERQAVLKTAHQLHRPLSSDETKKLQRLSAQLTEHHLDHGTGSCDLRNSTIAEQVCAALLHFHESRYRLFAWCIMPNHVHVVFKAFPGHTLSEIAHSWKSFTASSANRILRRRVSFWQREYYDHLIRDEVELKRAIRYVADNPEKANLKNWKWVWVCGQDAPTTAGEDGGATITS
jgi:REP element-mobilizing transposase RayT